MNRRLAAVDVIVPGLIAGVLFSGAAALFGRRDSGSAAAALNAPSQFLWGDADLDERRYTLRHTLPGVAINSGAGMFWAAIMQGFLPRSGRRALGRALLAGTAASSLAWVVDYHLIPRRLSPGVQERVSARSLVGIHGLFGLGLGLGAWLVARQGADAQDWCARSQR